MHAAEEFVVGVNLPWVMYGSDFGASAWHPDGGVGAPGRQAHLDAILARLAALGLRHVRWFVLCDGRAGIRFDLHGRPQGLDPFFFRDLDAAVSAASRFDLSLTLVLFDFTWCARRRVVNGVALGGRRALLRDGALRTELLDRVVRPMLVRYRAEAAVAAWDLFNEPEWPTLGYGTLNPFAALRPRTMRALLGELAALVHAETRQPATVGLASRRGFRLLRHLDLDFYQVHWYGRHLRQLRPVAGGWRDRPVVLGEFPTNGVTASGLEILRAARAAGYCGAFGWSALARDAYSQFEALERSVRAWRA